MCREIIIVANASQSLMAEASDRQHKLRADGACKCHLAAYALMNVEGMWLEVERHACEWCLGISCSFPRMVIVPLRSSAYRIGNLRPCLSIGRGETACLHCKIDIGP